MSRLAHQRRVDSFVCLFLIAISRPAFTQTIGDEPPPRWYDETIVEQGQQIYQANCAQCHGERAQGDPNWRQRDKEGKFPPPPLDGTGHTWHHPIAALLHVIMKGSPGGLGNMPGWEGKLTEDEAAATIAWFQSLWPDQAYSNWYQIEVRSRQ